MSKTGGRSPASESRCQPDDVFVAYVLGDLPTRQRTELERHARVCAECRLRLNSFRDAGAALDSMFTRSPRRRELAPAAKLLDAILAQIPEQKLYYDTADFPGFRSILAAATDRGLCFISFRAAEQEYLSRWADADFTVVHSPSALKTALEQMHRYFEGRLRKFDLPVDLRFASEFTRQVLAETSKIGYGQLATYQDIANRIRKPRATRAVGNALGRNPIPIVVPCHRVVASGGGFGGYTGGLDIKRKLLRIEGIETTGGDLFA